MDNQSTIIPPPAQESTTSGYPSFWRRLGALILDFLIIIFGGAIVAMLLRPILEPAIARLGITILYGLYFVLMHGLYGASLGKMLLGIQVCKLDGSPIDITAAAIRYSPLFIFTVLATLSENAALSPSATISIIAIGASMIQPLFILASCIVLLVNKQNRTIHDFIGKTVVMHKAQEDSVVV